uniref:Uncharacterized protein n=1 Tax=Ananas comosus var. bracteatus TaxID=296719 RepID=A0A6V7PY69_ANACO|nr:unnamed protein product [Ananas comosus var. bracteatus]
MPRRLQGASRASERWGAALGMVVWGPKEVQTKVPYAFLLAVGSLFFLHSPYLECYMIATIELPPAFIPNYNAPFLECEMIAIIGPTFLATMKSSLAPIMKRTTELLGIKGNDETRDFVMQKLKARPA